MAARKPLVQDSGSLKELPSGDTLSGVVHSATITAIVTLTQSAYDALDPPDANTLYIITD